MIEQRRSNRQYFPQPIQYRLIPGQEPKGCLGCDYSAGGVRFKSQDFIPLNTSLFLDIMSPTRNLMQIAGKVVWVQRVPHGEAYQVGVAFEALPFQAGTSPQYSM